MFETAAEIDVLVERELARITQPELIALVRQLRVATRKEDRPWAYGAENQTFPCWIVLEHKASNTGVAYCSSGFGPRHPWGLLFLTGPHLSMEMDSGWFASLDDAIRESVAWSGENPPGYQVE